MGVCASCRDMHVREDRGPAPGHSALRHSEHARLLSNIKKLTLPSWGSMLPFWSPTGDYVGQLVHGHWSVERQLVGCLLFLSIQRSGVPVRRGVSGPRAPLAQSTRAIRPEAHKPPVSAELESGPGWAGGPVPLWHCGPPLLAGPSRLPGPLPVKGGRVPFGQFHHSSCFPGAPSSARPLLFLGLPTQASSLTTWGV